MSSSKDVSDPGLGPADARREPRDSTRTLLLIGKAAVTIGLFAFLFSRLDLTHFGEVIGDSRKVWVIVAALANGLLILSSTLKWGALLRALGILVEMVPLLRIYLIGFFVGTFLPGKFGGDVIRCYLVPHGKGKRVSIAATILVERVTGVIALVVVCLLVVALAPARFATKPVLILCAGVTLALVVGIAIALSRKLATIALVRSRRTRLRRVGRLACRLHRVLWQFSPRSIAVAMVYSFLFYLAGGLTFYCICLAFGADVSYVEAVAVRALVCMLLLLPISIGGAGLSQAGDVYMLGLLGVDLEPALGISILGLILDYLYVLLGGLAFLGWRGRAETQEQS